MLRPCPYCKDCPESFARTGKQAWRVVCNNEGCSHRPFFERSSQEEAEKQWNNNASEQELEPEMSSGYATPDCTDDFDFDDPQNSEFEFEASESDEDDDVDVDVCLGCGRYYTHCSRIQLWEGPGVAPQLCRKCWADNGLPLLKP